MSTNTPTSIPATVSPFADSTEAQSAARSARSAGMATVLASAARAAVDVFTKNEGQTKESPSSVRTSAAKCK